MKKWAVITGNGRDEFIEVHKKEQSIREAKRAWESLTRFEKKTQTIIAGIVNLDDNGNYEEVNGQIDADIYEIAFENGKIKK